MKIDELFNSRKPAAVLIADVRRMERRDRSKR